MRPSLPPVRREIWIGGKFVLLAIFATAIYFFGSIAMLAAALVGTALAHLASRIAPARILQPLRMLAPFLVVIGLAVFLFDGPSGATIVVLRLTVLLLAAHLVTETTGTGEMIDAFTLGLSPLRVLGVDSERVGMALALTLRFVPMLAVVAHEVVEAQKARGHNRNLVAVAVPLIVRSLKMADEVSEALDARGFDATRPGKQCRLDR